MSMKVIELLSYLEPWEKKKFILKNEEIYYSLLKKYIHMCLFDDDNNEIRRIVDMEWHAAR